MQEYNTSIRKAYENESIKPSPWKPEIQRKIFITDGDKEKIRIKNSRRRSLFQSLGEGTIN